MYIQKKGFNIKYYLLHVLNVIIFEIHSILKVLHILLLMQKYFIHLEFKLIQKITKNYVS